MDIRIYKSYVHNGEQKIQTIHHVKTPEEAVSYMDDMHKRAKASKHIGVYPYWRGRHGCYLSVRFRSGTCVDYFFVRTETGLSTFQMQQLINRM